MRHLSERVVWDCAIIDDVVNNARECTYFFIHHWFVFCFECIQHIFIARTQAIAFVCKYIVTNKLAFCLLHLTISVYKKNSPRRPMRAWINLCSDASYCKIKTEILFRMRIWLEHSIICHAIHNANIFIYTFMSRLGSNVDTQHEWPSPLIKTHTALKTVSGERWWLLVYFIIFKVWS